MMKIGDKIQQIRKSRKMTQQEVAEKIGISQNHLSQIESGKRGLKVELLPALAKTLGCKIEDFFGEGEPPLKVYTESILVPLFPDISLICRDADDVQEALRRTKADKTEIVFLDPHEDASVSARDVFATYTDSDAMTEAGIHKGDIVIVQLNREPHNGDVILACYGTDATPIIRWCYIAPDGSFSLRAANPLYPDIHITQDNIKTGWFKYVGKVIFVHSQPKTGL
jgi:transcriptional regulator with XRE-family HTH domain